MATTTCINGSNFKNWTKFYMDNNLEIDDDIIMVQDIPAEDLTKMDRLEFLSKKAYRTSDENTEMVTLQAELIVYMPTADVINGINARVYGMQVYLKEGVVIFINEKKQELIDLVNNHKYMGIFQLAVTYKQGNMVMYDGFGFISKVDNNVGHTPDKEAIEDDYWIRFTIKGDKGDPSLNLSVKKGSDGTANYDNTLVYNVGDACVFNHRLYYCLVDGTLGINPTDTDHWACADKIWVGTDEPTDHWIIWWDTNTGENVFKRYSDNGEWVRQNVKAIDTIISDSGGYFAIKNNESALQQLGSSTIYKTATGDGNAINLSLPTLIDGYSITFIANANNNANSTTVNGKNLYKPNTIAPPTLIQGKAYTIWYNQSGDNFFIKASAEGTAVAYNVLAGTTFSNDIDTGMLGGMPNNGARIITPSTYNQTIPVGYHNGGGYVAGDANLISSNIANGKSIFGILGNYTGDDLSYVDIKDVSAYILNYVTNNNMWKTTYTINVPMNGINVSVTTLAGKYQYRDSMGNNLTAVSVDSISFTFPKKIKIKFQVNRAVTHNGSGSDGFMAVMFPSFYLKVFGSHFLSGSGDDQESFTEVRSISLGGFYSPIQNLDYVSYTTSSAPWGGGTIYDTLFVY